MGYNNTVLSSMVQFCVFIQVNVIVEWYSWNKMFHRNIDSEMSCLEIYCLLVFIYCKHTNEHVNRSRSKVCTCQGGGHQLHEKVAAKIQIYNIWIYSFMSASFYRNVLSAIFLAISYYVLVSRLSYFMG